LPVALGGAKAPWCSGGAVPAEAGPAADAPFFDPSSRMSETNDSEDERQNQGGRPRKDPRDRRTKRYGLRLSPKEYEEIQDRAERAGLSVAEYLRRKALGKKVKTKVEEEAIRQIRRVGTNLNQVARWANQGKDEAVRSAAEDVIEDVKTAMKQLL